MTTPTPPTPTVLFWRGRGCPVCANPDMGDDDLTHTILTNGTALCERHLYQAYAACMMASTGAQAFTCLKVNL